MKTYWLLSAAFLTGCSSIYTSPRVTKTTEVNKTGIQVRVIPLTAESARFANLSPYKPKTLPNAFKYTTNIPVRSDTGLTTPTLATAPETRPTKPEATIPPRLKPEPYRIGVADVLLLATPSAASTVEQLSGLLAAQNKRQGYTVQDDGAIAIPDVGRVSVAGLTVDEAEAKIFTALVKNQINPMFSLEVAEFNSQRATVGGAVGKPTLVPISLKPLHLGEALQLAGGITAKDQDYTTIRLYRDGKLYEIPLTKFLSNAKLQKIRLKDQDSVYVDTTFDLSRAQAYFAEQIQLMTLKSAARSQALTQLNTEITIRRGRADEQRSNFVSSADLDALPRDYVYLTGELAKPGRFTLPFSHKASLADAIYSKDGIPTKTGNVAQIYVLRGNQASTSVTAYQLNGRNVANMMMATRLELRPNDIIFVAEQPITKWSRVITQISPTLIGTVIRN